MTKVTKHACTCGILVPQTGIEPQSPALEGGLLTIGPSGRSLHQHFKIWKLMSVWNYAYWRFRKAKEWTFFDMEETGVCAHTNGLIRRQSYEKIQACLEVTIHFGKTRWSLGFERGWGLQNAVRVSGGHSRACVQRPSQERQKCVFSSPGSIL